MITAPQTRPAVEEIAAQLGEFTSITVHATSVITTGIQASRRTA